jgi:hypothetical protein
VTALALTWFVYRRPEVPASTRLAPDPRRAYSGPFENIDPEVAYTPEARCAECHADLARSFAEHPMGRSLLPVAQTRIPPQDSRFHNPFDALGSNFQVGQSEDHLIHRRRALDPERLPIAQLELDWEVHYALGSGHQGFAYLTDREGYLFETPISWYSQKQVWDLSPGFGPIHLTGRAILPECLFCHANQAHFVAGSVNRYAQPVFDGYSIGCQRCHGPGERHVASPKPRGTAQSQVDYTIVNPRHLEPRLREAVCEQCHLQGQARTLRRGRGLYDYRPGLPLQDFWSVFVAAPGIKDSGKAVGHVEQMHQSKCFAASAGPQQLGCVSCHDPHQHVPPPRRIAYYRARCLQCHQGSAEGGRNATSPPCSLPLEARQSKADSCVDCHMSRYGTSDIPHAASTDHRILRHGRQSKEAGIKIIEEKRSDPLPLVAFYPDGDGPSMDEMNRDRAVALVKLALGGDPASTRVLSQVVPILEAALARDPEDSAAGEARGYALALGGRPADALRAFAAVLDYAPDQELVLVGAASVAETLRRNSSAKEYWQRAVAVNPWEPGYRRHLVQLLIKEEAWDEAGPQCKAWVRLDPLSAEARTALLQWWLAAGNQIEARKEYSLIEALAPANLLELRVRYARKVGNR